MTLSMLLAYDASGDVLATLDYCVSRDDDGNVVGLIDFAAHEDSGGEMLDVWNVKDAKGSKVWPEWLGSRAHEFRVELDGPPGNKRIKGLVHKASGYRRDRSVLEAEITKRVKDKKDKADAKRKNGAVVEPDPADIRDLVGGPDRPLVLDDDGRNKERLVAIRPMLPTVSVR